MSKHILDRTRPADGARAERYAEIERQSGADGSSDAAKALSKRPRARRGSSRTEHFTRIERGAGEV